ncbi:hypothetical protein [Geobacillus thermodenitrificans]|uniref:Uncharacterized protein n=1 Tax=Geobacillus thermodenitrificans TaxID=33940 RepID=A0ABY9QA63_GEOTD|nr:hypothetical protein [Geobacillus thermodenitrificans]WMV75436.1 hypothetical protein HSX42_14370 [Geobacillus thermodenitrificans]
MSMNKNATRSVGFPSITDEAHSHYTSASTLTSAATTNAMDAVMTSDMMMANIPVPSLASYFIFILPKKTRNASATF